MAAHRRARLSSVWRHRHPVGHDLAKRVLPIRNGPLHIAPTLTSTRTSPPPTTKCSHTPTTPRPDAARIAAAYAATCPVFSPAYAAHCSRPPLND